MNKRMRAAWVRCGVVTLSVLAFLLLAAPVEAKFKVKIKSTPKAPSATSVSKSHVPDVPKLHTKVETGPRIPNMNVTVTSHNRGFFQRLFNWVFFWRRPAPAPAPAVAPMAPAPTPGPVPPPAVAVAPAAPATPPVVVPIALPAAAPVSPVARGAVQDQEQGKEKAWEFPQVRAPKPEPIVKGYIVHLKNGRRISTIYYEDKGDQVVIPQHGGTFGLSKSLVARIEVVKE